jgi:hypothetical protein
LLAEIESWEFSHLARRSGEAFRMVKSAFWFKWRQISIAMENSLEYQELSELKDKITTEKLYLEEDIRSDQNIGNMIGKARRSNQFSEAYKS